MFQNQVKDKPFTLTLANGKSESFESGYKMWEWFNKQKNINKTPEDKREDKNNEHRS